MGSVFDENSRLFVLARQGRRRPSVPAAMAVVLAVMWAHTSVGRWMMSVGEWWPESIDSGLRRPPQRNRLEITDAAGFQDHRNRPLGHLSASNLCRNLRA